jgi:hypothetical protein
MLIPSVDFRMIKSYQPVNKDDNLCESSDDEIIFVKEYKITALKVFKKLNAKKIIAKEAPRRNPIRKVRMKKHFKEYIDVSVFEEIEEYDNSIQQENYVVCFCLYTEYFTSDNEPNRIENAIHNAFLKLMWIFVF